MAKVLIVDDVEEYLASLENALRGEFEVMKASSLDEAKRLTDNSVDIALVDIRLSEEDTSNRDGLLYLEWVKMNFPLIPVIMMSAYREFDIAVDSLNLGASYFLRKPINLTELNALLRMFMDKKRAEEELAKLKGESSR
jgi:DNA-binding NtrC family response regulator